MTETEAETETETETETTVEGGNRKLDPDRSDSDRSGSVLSMFWERILIENNLFPGTCQWRGGNRKLGPDRSDSDRSG